MDEIDPNKLGDLLQDTYNNMHMQEQVQESQENKQMISESEEEFDSEEDYHEEENMEEDIQQSTTTLSEVQATITRSGHVSHIPARYQHLQAKAENTEEYTMDNARVLDKIFFMPITHSSKPYSLKAGIKKFGESWRKSRTR